MKSRPVPRGPFRRVAEALGLRRAAGRPTRPLRLLSSVDRVRPWTAEVHENLRAFCIRHAIVPLLPVGSHPRMAGIRPQWSKIPWLLDALAESATPIAWMDDDVVVTNGRRDFLRAHLRMLERSGRHLLVARDAGDLAQVNTGILILRPTDEARRILERTWALRDEPFRGWTLGTAPSSLCLHDQQAFNGLLRDAAVARDVLVVSPRGFFRNLNTFHRESHRDEARGMDLDYSGDPPRYRWRPGDVTAHCTGMDEALRLRKIRECLRLAR